MHNGLILSLKFYFEKNELITIYTPENTIFQAI